MKLRSWFLLLVLLAVPLLPFVLVGELPGDVWLQAAEGANAIGFTGAALLAADVILPIPSSVVGTLVSARLGLWRGFLFTTVGLVVGHMLGYALGRLWPLRWAPQVKSVPSAWLVFMSRPVPVLSEAAAVGAGATRMRFGKFVTACVAGNVIYALVLAATGAQFLPRNQIGLALMVPMAIPAVSWLCWRRWLARHDGG